MTDAVVYSFPKNGRERVLATLKTYKGIALADLRVYVPGAEGEAKPTTKGLALRVEDLPKLLEAVKALIAARDGYAA